MLPCFAHDNMLPRSMARCFSLAKLPLQRHTYFNYSFRYCKWKCSRIFNTQHLSTARACCSVQQPVLVQASNRLRHETVLQKPVQCQPIDYTTLVAISNELRTTFCPGKIEQVLQGQDELILLKVRTLESSAWIQLSWHATTGHVAIIHNPPERGAAAEAFSFGAQLHACLRGLVLSHVEVPSPWERVLRLDFAVRPAEPAQQQLHCEIMGRYSNVVLTDGSGTIAAAGYQVGGKMSRLRQVQAGKKYELPPQAPGIDPDSCPTLEEWKGVILQAAEQHEAHRQQGTILSGCVRAFRGVSPALVSELCHAAGCTPSEAVQSLTAQQWEGLFAQWQLWLERVQQHNFAASSCPTSGRYSLLGSYAQRESLVLDLLGRYYTQIQAREQFLQMKQKLQRTVTQAVQRLEKKSHSLQKQGGQSDKHVRTQKLADLLMANVYRCTPGMAFVEVEDWDSPGTMLTIPLDPLKSAVEAAEALYRQARKQRRAVDQVAPLLEEAQAQLEYMAEVELMLGQLEEGGAQGEDEAGSGPLAALREVQAELVSGGYMKPPPETVLAAKASSKARRAQKRSAGGSGSGSGYRQYLSPAGLKVLVGRNSRQNDELTMRVANDGDMWMHARGVPGAHVLLRVPDGREAGDADVQFAADLAAWFSKARAEGKADVTCASPVDIKKPKGARPGQVLVTRERVVVGRPPKSAAALAGEED